MVSTRRSAAATLNLPNNTLSTSTRIVPQRKVKKITALSGSTSTYKVNPMLEHSAADTDNMTERFKSEEQPPHSVPRPGAGGLLNTSTESIGTSVNPIELNDSPICQTTKFPKRKFASFIDLEDLVEDHYNADKSLRPEEQKRLRPNEPHQFARNRPGFFQGDHEVGYNRVSPNRNPNPNAFTGHRELDMYRMARARSGAASGPHGHSSSYSRLTRSARDNKSNVAHLEPRKKDSRTVPQVMTDNYLRAEVSRLRSTQASRPSPYVVHPGNIIGYPPYEHHHPWTQPGFRRIYSDEPHGTPLPPWFRRSGPAFYHAPATIPPGISQLQATTSQLAQLLAFYPACEEPARLMQDITALVHAQYQQVSTWQVVENARPPRHPSVTTLSVNSAKESSITTPPPPSISKDTQTSPKLQRARSKQDDDVRQYMLSRANIWKDGHGQSLADVYAVKSSPAPRTESQLSHQTETRRNSLPPIRGDSKARRGRYERY